MNPNLLSLPELRQSQQIVKDFTVLVDLLDKCQTDLYTYNHYQCIADLNHYINECKEELETRLMIHSKKLGEIHNEEN